VIGPADDPEVGQRIDALRACGADVIRLDDARDDAALVRAFVVIAVPRDEPLAQRLRALADRRGFLLCCVDQPRYSTFALPAVLDAGRARVAIWTGGASPRVAALIKEGLAHALDSRFARFLERMAERRRASRAGMREAAEGFALHAEVTYPPWFADEERT
jgi:siroheme synthase-like protein